MECLAVVSSINMVNRLRNQLNRAGEYFGMIRAPHGISQGGCGFALRFEENQLLQVKQVAQELGVVINGIYQEENYDNGSRVYIRIG